jgi:broad specificity phosphatase PhoE
MDLRVTRLHLVRHGRAAAGWDTHADPGLDALGRHQAAALCADLMPVGPLPIVTSPMLRCRQTSEPLATAWAVVPRVETAVGEIPSPEGVAMGDRVEWLRVAMRSTWDALGPRYAAYRDAVVSTLRSIARRAAVEGCEGAVVFSHFVAINAAIGAAIDDDRVLIHRLDNCSVTTIDVDLDADGDGGEDRSTLRLVEPGHEADTQIR